MGNVGVLLLLSFWLLSLLLLMLLLLYCSLLLLLLSSCALSAASNFERAWHAAAGQRTRRHSPADCFGRGRRAAWAWPKHAARFEQRRRAFTSAIGLNAAIRLAACQRGRNHRFVHTHTHKPSRIIPKYLVGMPEKNRALFHTRHCVSKCCSNLTRFRSLARSLSRPTFSKL